MKIMTKIMKNAVIVAYGRSAIGRSKKGSLANIHPVTFGAQVLKGVLAKVPELDPKEIDDLIVGCAKPEEMQGKNMARIIAQAANLPDEVSGQTVNRFCASGLQAVAAGASVIMTGQAKVIVAGGVESMSMLPMVDNPGIKEPNLVKNNPEVYMPMGITAENVAAKYQITREEQDEFGYRSQMLAAKAQENAGFLKEIIPIEYTDDNDKTQIFDSDECIRPSSNLEQMGQLRTVFYEENGTVTAGNASSTADGAAFIVLMCEEKARELGITPIAKYLGYTVAGVDPAYMGTGPIYAIPQLMQQLDMSVDEFDIIELNEAFAAQVIPCIRELGLDEEKVNPRGGAIALGHPLGATGAILLSKALHYLEDIGGGKALIAMCIGGGMGAAGAFELLNN